MVQTILLASTSELKLECLKKYLKEHDNENENIIDTMNCDSLGLPSQPMNCAQNCAKARLDYVKHNSSKKYDFYIAIENGIEEENDEFYEACHVLIEHHNILSHGCITRYRIDFVSEDKDKYKLGHAMQKMLRSDKIVYDKNISGFKKTLGEFLKDNDSTVDPKNWLKSCTHVDRCNQISDSIMCAFLRNNMYQLFAKEILNKYQVYLNFPKAGVEFYDIFPVFKDSNTFNLLIKLLAKKYQYNNIDYVIGGESRGFCIGVALAYKIGAGFIPIRKKGKLPGNVITASYEKEYGKDEFEIQTDVNENSQVILIDDLIATGGSLRAMIDLTLSLKLKIYDCLVLKEVVELRTDAQKIVNYPYTVLFQEN